MLLHLLLLEVVSAGYYVTENTDIYYPDDVINKPKGQTFDYLDFNKEHLSEQDYQKRADVDYDAAEPTNDINDYNLDTLPVSQGQTGIYDENYVYNNVDSLGLKYDDGEGYNFELNDDVYSPNVQPRNVSVVLYDDPYEDVDYDYKYVRGRTTKKTTKSTNKKTITKTKKKLTTKKKKKLTTKTKKKLTTKTKKKLTTKTKKKLTTKTKKPTATLKKPTVKTTTIKPSKKKPLTLKTNATEKLDHFAYVRKSTYDESENSFGSLPEYEVRATRVQESRYPWLARVVHSRSKHYPHVATAICVDTRIFITSAKSVFSLKVPYTSVIYSGKQAPVVAIVLPSNPSRLYYDDIGILVVKDGFIFNWRTVQMFQAPRTDIYFNWFEDRNLNENGPLHHKAVGYALNQNISSIATVELKHELVEMDVVLGVEICVVAYTSLGNGLTGYHVPCYYPCTPKELFNVVTNNIKNSNCAKYLGVGGAAVYDTKTNTLMGIATWGEEVAPGALITLPVGVAIPNSRTFLNDYECAKKIRNDKKQKIFSGYYNSLCNN